MILSPNKKILKFEIGKFPDHYWLESTVLYYYHGVLTSWILYVVLYDSARDWNRGTKTRDCLLRQQEQRVHVHYG